MPRNMSFLLTKPQILDETKTVTTRRGWGDLKPGELFWAIERGQGLKRGEKVKRLKLLRCVRNTPFVLDTITKDIVVQEGFPTMTPAEFVAMFCKSVGGRPDQVANQIEFEYVPRDQWPAGDNE